MLGLSRYGLRHGVELKINWPGRIGVAPVMGAPFFAMAGVHWLALVMLYAGMVAGAAGDRALRPAGHPGGARRRAVREPTQAQAQIDPLNAAGILAVSPIPSAGGIDSAWIRFPTWARWRTKSSRI